MLTAATMILAQPREVLAAAATLPAISILVVALRFAARRYQGMRFGADDWLTIPALPLLVGMGVTLILSEVLGLKQYPQTQNDQTPSSGNVTNTGDLVLSLLPSTWAEQDVPFTDTYDPTFMLTAKCLWAFQLIMYVFTALTKLSVLFFYRRMFWPQAYPNLGRATMVTSWFVVVWSLTFFVLNIFDCGREVSLNWSPMRVYPKTKCFADVRLEEPYAATDLALNVIILLLPLPTIHGLALNLRRRAAVGIVLVLGSTAIAASAVRLVLFVQLVQVHERFNTPMTSREWTYMVMQIWVTTMYWSIIEAGIALQTACLPALCIFLPRKMLGNQRTGRTGSLITQMGNRERGGAGAAGTGGGAGPDDVEAAASAYPRSSGWFIRFREPAAGAGAAQNTGGGTTRERHLIGSGISQISALDLDTDNIGIEEERGRSLYRSDEIEMRINVQHTFGTTFTRQDSPGEGDAPREQGTA